MKNAFSISKNGLTFIGYALNPETRPKKNKEGASLNPAKDKDEFGLVLLDYAVMNTLLMLKPERRSVRGTWRILSDYAAQGNVQASITRLKRAGYVTSEVIKIKINPRHRWDTSVMVHSVSDTGLEALKTKQFINKIASEIFPKKQ